MIAGHAFGGYCVRAAYACGIRPRLPAIAQRAIRRQNGRASLLNAVRLRGFDIIGHGVLIALFR